MLAALILWQRIIRFLMPMGIRILMPMGIRILVPMGAYITQAPQLLESDNFGDRAYSGYRISLSCPEASWNLLVAFKEGKRKLVMNVAFMLESQN